MLRSHCVSRATAARGCSNAVVLILFSGSNLTTEIVMRAQIVIPAQAGTHVFPMENRPAVDSRMRGNDGTGLWHGTRGVLLCGLDLCEVCSLALACSALLVANSNAGVSLRPPTLRRPDPCPIVCARRFSICCAGTLRGLKSLTGLRVLERWGLKPSAEGLRMWFLSSASAASQL